MRYTKYFLLSATILLMVLIFVFSSQPADDSTRVSNSAGAFLCRLFIPGFTELSEEQQTARIEAIDHTVRKCAHASEYFLLGLLCCASAAAWLSLKTRFLFLIGWVIAILYSVTDEIHQIFVPGRACMFTDILIDAGGALAGAVLFLLIWSFRHRK